MIKILKNEGRERQETIKRKQNSRKQKCKKCKCTILIDSEEVQESSYKVGNKIFVDCKCGEQVVLK